MPYAQFWHLLHGCTKMRLAAVGPYSTPPDPLAGFGDGMGQGVGNDGKV